MEAQASSLGIPIIYFWSAGRRLRQRLVGIPLGNSAQGSCRHVADLLTGCDHAAIATSVSENRHNNMRRGRWL